MRDLVRPRRAETGVRLPRADSLIPVLESTYTTGWTSFRRTTDSVDESRPGPGKLRDDREELLTETGLPLATGHLRALEPR